MNSHQDHTIFKYSKWLLTAIMGGSVVMYSGAYDLSKMIFVRVQYPDFLVATLIVVKTLGLLAIWIPKWPKLSIMAYAGFAFNSLLALQAHIMAPNGFGWKGIAIALLSSAVALICYWLSFGELRNKMK